MKLLLVVLIYSVTHLACSEVPQKQPQRKIEILQPTIVDKKSLLIKDVEPVPSIQNGQKNKGNFVAEESYNYYPADYVYQRRPHYGPVAFPDYSPHDNYYPSYKPHLHARDPYFWNSYDAYDRRRFNSP